MHRPIVPLVDSYSTANLIEVPLFCVAAIRSKSPWVYCSSTFRYPLSLLCSAHSMEQNLASNPSLIRLLPFSFLSRTKENPSVTRQQTSKTRKSDRDAQNQNVSGNY